MGWPAERIRRKVRSLAGRALLRSKSRRWRDGGYPGFRAGETAGSHPQGWPRENVITNTAQRHQSNRDPDPFSSFYGLGHCSYEKLDADDLV